VAQQQWDVIHIEHLRAAHLGHFIPPTVPMVYDSVDCISLLLERTLRNSHSSKQRMVAALELSRTRRYESRLMGLFNHVVVTSADDARALQNLAPGTEATVIPNGVDLDYFQPMNQPTNSETLVLSGKMSYHANATAALHFVRDIYPLVKQTHPNVKLRIVGSNPPESIKALTKDLSIEVTGFLPDIRQGFTDAAIALAPLVVKVGIQNKTLEAMAMKIPVVSSRAGYEGLSAEPDQELLVADTPEQFARDVCRLLDHPELRRTIGAAGRLYVERNHQWDAMAQKLERVYAEAIDLNKDQAVSFMIGCKPQCAGRGS
jgi:glycosyltransferase involved in cell wall biosynthesis